MYKDYITLQDLNTYSISEEYLDFFAETYPNGESINNILNDERAPSGFIHWMFNFLPLNEVQKDIYEQRFNIKNSQNVLSSKNIEDSNYIFSSRNCKSSEYIKDSSTIETSHTVLGSRKIKQSKYIYLSKNVLDSSFVVQSENIHKSNNIAESKEIYNSDSILKSKNITDCIGITNSQYLKNCILSVGCQKSQNLIFCYGLTGEENCIFNIQVPEEEYLKVKEEVLKHLTESVLDFITYNNSPTILKDTSCLVNEHIPTYYKKLPEELFNYLKTLPYYDSFLLYKITLNPKVLK